MTYSELHPVQKRLVIALLSELKQEGDIDSRQSEITRLQAKLEPFVKACPIAAMRHIYEVTLKILDDTFWSLTPEYKDFNENNTVEIILRTLYPEMIKVSNPYKESGR